MQTLKLRKRIDPIIPALGIALSLFGLVMILSASQISAAEKYGNAYHFFTRQFIAWIIGMGGLFFFLKVPLEKLYQWRGKFLIATLILLVLVLIPFIGGSETGVNRWIHIGGWQLQPSDLAKLFMLIYYSGWLASKDEDVGHVIKGFIPFLLVTMVVLGLVEMGHDLDTVVTIAVMTLSIFWVARSRWWQTPLMIAMGIGAVLILIFGTSYRLDRWNTFISGGSNDQLTTSYHSKQAIIAIGNGGLWGVGFGQGISKYAYLPESHTDSVFAVMAEELGFVRSSLVIIAYLVLGWRIYLIALKANSRFVKLLAVGGGVLLVFQTFVNIGGMLGLIPLSGITLPLLSYGGTSLIVNMSLIGLMTNISRETI